MNEAFVRARCDWDEFLDWASFVAEERNSPEAVEKFSGVPASDIRQSRAPLRHGRQCRNYYGLGVTEHSQGSRHCNGHRQPRMVTGNLGRRGVGVNPLRGPEQCAGLLRHGIIPARVPRI